jgi:phospholipid-transporting ATPase
MQQAEHKASPRRMSTMAGSAPERVVELRHGEIVLPKDAHGRDVPFIDNRIRTSKYTVLSFVPHNLFEQLVRPANFYFVCIAVLQSIPQVSVSNGKPTILLPLLFVLIVSAVKDAVEDYKRHVEDNKENQQRYEVFLPDATFIPVRSQEIKVGNFVRISDDETYPADILLLHATGKGGFSYVETANLDGETNLKIKMPPETTKFLNSDDALREATIKVIADPVNGHLDSFGGRVIVNGDEHSETRVGIDNLLLRGSRLRNTGRIIGLVIYTGEETKIRQNSVEKRRAVLKRSSVEQLMNKQILGMFLLQVCICFLAAVGAGVWARTQRLTTGYIAIDEAPAEVGVTSFFTWFIVFSGFVPISLLVSMEVVKFMQGIFMGWDSAMAYEVGGEYQYARAQTSGLNEELGQVEFVLSDKTGTLTCNKMDFRKCVIGARQYGSGDTDISRAARARARENNEPVSPLLSDAGAVDDYNGAELPEGKPRPETLGPHVSFNARNKLSEALSAGGKAEREFLLALSLANTVFPTLEADARTKKQEIVLKASSPDEKALVEFARFVGYLLVDRNPPWVTLRVPLPDGSGFEDQRYEQLALLDFTSKRKRMTVVLRAPNGRIRVFSKGADNVIAALLRRGARNRFGDEDEKSSGAGRPPPEAQALPSNDAELEEAQPAFAFTVGALARFGEQGLRTLLVASSDLDADWWDDPQRGWGQRYNSAMSLCAVEGPSEKGHFKGACSDKCRRCAIELEVEQAAQMDLVGATAIEDKLQDDVPEAIRSLLEAGINVWVLTGDKLETAINIGMACNLLEPAMESAGNLLRIVGETVDAVEAEIDQHLQYLQARKHDRELQSGPLGLVISSRALLCIMKGAPATGEFTPMMRRFWEVAVQCKSVVGCRMQPNQKAVVVRMVKNSTEKGVITLAIGDGANDELMIREANVGVGIRGVEGTSAVRASDYAISQFCYLKRLLLVHGRLNYRRIATLICYIFYKNSLICLTQLWFGFYSGFSGQPIFLEWAYQLYNVSFTALPVLVFAVLDRDMPFSALMSNPRIYRLTSGAQLFNRNVFWQWMFLSLVHSLIVFFYPMEAFNMHSPDRLGHTYDLWSVGLVVYTAVVLIVNLKIALMMTSWTWVHHFVVWGSIIFYFLCLLVFNSSIVFATAGGDYFGLVYNVFALDRFWLALLLTVVTCLVFDYTMHALDALSPTKQPQAQLAAAREQLISERSITESQAPQAPQPPQPHQPPPMSRTTSSLRRAAARTHTGFDFSHTPGQGHNMGFKY